MKRSCLVLVSAVVLALAGCATPIPPAQPVAMVPKTVKAGIPPQVGIYVEKPALDSAARKGKAPFDDFSGAFPLVQAQGLVNLQEAARLTLAAAGARTSNAREGSTYVLQPVILGAMSIPFPDAYALLFVRYQLADARTSAVVWSQDVYSQERLDLDKADRRWGSGGAVDLAYGRVAAANLQQMADALSGWFAQQPANER